MQIPVAITGSDGSDGSDAEDGPVEIVEVLLVHGPRRRRIATVAAAAARYRVHPEVPLTDAQLDEALARCGFARAVFGGRWASGQVR
ncbi:MAG: hypothetical protein ACRCYU_08545, partial [Nocardioides sp.]